MVLLKKNYKACTYFYQQLCLYHSCKIVLIVDPLFAKHFWVSCHKGNAKNKWIDDKARERWSGLFWLLLCNDKMFLLYLPERY